MSNVRNDKFNLTQFWESKHTASKFFLFQCYIAVNPVNDDFIRHVTISLKDLKHQMSSYVPFSLINSHASEKNQAYAFVYSVLLGQILGSKVLFFTWVSSRKKPPKKCLLKSRTRLNYLKNNEILALNVIPMCFML